MRVSIVYRVVPRVESFRLDPNETSPLALPPPSRSSLPLKSIDTTPFLFSLLSSSFRSLFLTRMRHPKILSNEQSPQFHAASRNFNNQQKLPTFWRFLLFFTLSRMTLTFTGLHPLFHPTLYYFSLATQIVLFLSNSRTINSYFSNGWELYFERKNMYTHTHTHTRIREIYACGREGRSSTPSYWTTSPLFRPMNISNFSAFPVSKGFSLL